MKQTRWQPFSPVFTPFQNLQTEMNRLFDRWGDGGSRPFAAAFPPVNVWEDDDRVFVEAELPGMKAEDLDIQVLGGTELTIKGERQPCVPENGVLHRQERAFGNFTRTLTLPFAVDADKVEARFENGVLVIQLPKHAAAKPRKIEVKGE